MDPAVHVRAVQGDTPSVPFRVHHVQTNNGRRFTPPRQSPLPAIQVMGLKDAHALLVVSFRAG